MRAVAAHAPRAKCVSIDAFAWLGAMICGICGWLVVGPKCIDLGSATTPCSASIVARSRWYLLWFNYVVHVPNNAACEGNKHKMAVT